MTHMSQRLAGRIALVTGASSGLGSRFAVLMAREGARCVLAARRKERLADVVAAIRAEGGEAIGVSCDVTQEGDIVAAFDEAEAHFGLVDTIVANAGMTTSASALDQTADEFLAVMDLNVRGVFLTAREGARRLIASGAGERGRIVGIASIGASEVLPGVAAYCASKAAVVMMVRSLAREWARHGIAVNALSPGYIATELNTEWLHGESGQRMLSRTARRRIMAAESLDEALLLLASDGARWMTGSNIVVDDGQTL
jgi:NAD(P)-dependent dehydrogenase (short-subunit alcohol dehydrogenase family)